MTFELLIFVLLGIAAGLLSGLFGVGGGIVIVPTLLWLLPTLGFNSPELTLVAVSTSLVSTFFVTNLAMIQHHAKGGVDFHVLVRLGIGVAVGALVGAFVAKLLPGHILKICFAIFLSLLGAYLLLLQKEHAETQRKLPSLFVMNISGFFVGFVATILGIAGGFISLPLLFAFGLSGRHAIGTACGVGAIITTVGSLSYLLEDFQQIPFHDMYGTVYLPAALIIGISSSAISPYAVALAHKLPTKILRRCLGIGLLVLGQALLWR